MASNIEARPLPSWERWLYGGAGSVAPQAIIGITVDFSSVFATFTPVAFIGWLIRAVLLIAIGGFVSFLHRKETDPWRAFLIGLSAPALLSTLIAGTSHPGGAGIADRPETQSAFVVNGTAQAAIPPDEAPAARPLGRTRGVAVALDTGSILPELTRGILGRRPALGFLAIPAVSRVRALADLSADDRICGTREGLDMLARRPGPLRSQATAMALAELAVALRTGRCDAAVLVSQASPAAVAGYFAPVGIVAVPLR
ncbi:MAG TPA: hypothetical protein VLE23_17530 [Geminicoccaceae bacterium]|nr:hypothetical protein [Geminicoccaceae bacterium]